MTRSPSMDLELLVLATSSSVEKRVRMCIAAVRGSLVLIVPLQADTFTTAAASDSLWSLTFC